MSKTPLAEGLDPKPIEANAPANRQEKNIEPLVEIAAEQLTDLFWKHWLYNKSMQTRKPCHEQFSLLS